MSYIIVTGGTGFLGSHLCKRLIKEGEKVLCIDNNYTGSLKNVSQLLDNDNFKFINGDIINPISIKENIKQIYNLACPASPLYYQGKSSIMTTKTCVLGALNMLELAKEKSAVILQASTSEIYGQAQESPQKETYYGNVNPIGIRSCYDEGKRCAESLFFDYWRQEAVDIKVVRIFNTYGPYMSLKDGRVICNFIYQALRGENLTVYGDGEQTRSFCFVDDLIDIMIKIMNTPKDFTGPINIGNDAEFTVNELANMIILKINKSLGIVYKPIPSDDPLERKPDISLAKDKFNWSPRAALSEGLDKTIEYFRKILFEEDK